MRLIDADAFAKFIATVIERNHYDTLLIDRYLTVKDVLEVVIDELNGNSIDGFENAPTIDAVQVVRCGECKWFQCNMRPDGYLPNGVDEYECRHWCGGCNPTDFCSYGETKGR